MLLTINLNVEHLFRLCNVDINTKEDRKMMKMFNTINQSTTKEHNCTQLHTKTQSIAFEMLKSISLVYDDGNLRSLDRSTTDACGVSYRRVSCPDGTRMIGDRSGFDSLARVMPHGRANSSIFAFSTVVEKYCHCYRWNLTKMMMMRQCCWCCVKTDLAS